MGDNVARRGDNASRYLPASARPNATAYSVCRSDDDASHGGSIRTDICPESGFRMSMDSPSTTAPIAEGNRTPPHNGKSVSCLLIQDA
jgi:hypothetical protein